MFCALQTSKPLGHPLLLFFQLSPNIHCESLSTTVPIESPWMKTLILKIKVEISASYDVICVNSMKASVD